MSSFASTRDIALPEEWYSHPLQSALFTTGLRVPVFADALAKELIVRGHMGPDDSIPGDYRGICYIPGIPNEFLYHLTRTYGNPLTEMAPRERTVIVITPPLACFDKHHLLGAKVVLDKMSDEPLMVLHKEAPPPTLEFDVQHAFQHMQCAMHKMFPEIPFDFMGARLNNLASGLQNIVCYLRMSCDINETEQRYIDTSEVVTSVIDGHRPFVRTRVIPMPSLDAFTDNGYLIRVSVEESHHGIIANNEYFTRIFDGAQAFITSGFGCNLSFRHVKVNRAPGEIVICVHDPSFKYETNTLLDAVNGMKEMLSDSLGINVQSFDVEKLITF